MFVRRRIGNYGIGNTAVGDLVLPRLHRHRGDGSHRLDSVDVNFAELLDESENRIELAAKALEPTVRAFPVERSTLRSPQDVQDWLGRAEASLLEAVKSGPILIN